MTERPIAERVERRECSLSAWVGQLLKPRQRPGDFEFHKRQVQHAQGLSITAQRLNKVSFRWNWASVIATQFSEPSSDRDTYPIAVWIGAESVPQQLTAPVAFASPAAQFAPNTELGGFIADANGPFGIVALALQRETLGIVARLAQGQVAYFPGGAVRDILTGALLGMTLRVA